MPEVTEHTAGMFSWADLATSDSKAALSFYKELMGWSSIDNPIDDQGNVYSMLQKNEKAACALYDMAAEMRDQGIPPHWTAYFTVSNVDETVAKAKRLGGTALQEPQDVFTAGRMAAIRDPEGATFALWQPRDEIGAQIFGEPGSLNWCELYTQDPNAQSAFYGGVFGWTRTDTTASAGQPYVVFQQDGNNAAGMMELQVPPSWTVYFGVDDCDATIEKAVVLGGSLANPAMDIPDLGRFALLADPQGAHFFVLQLKRSTQTG